MKRELGVDQVGQVILVMESEVEHSKFEHFYVEAYDKFSRKTADSRDSCVVKNISKMCSFTNR